MNAIQRLGSKYQVLYYLSKTLRKWVISKSSTGFSTTFSMTWEYSTTSSSSQSRMQNPPDNIVSSVWFFIRAITITIHKCHINTIVKVSLWHWYILITGNGLSIEKLKWSILMLKKPWMKNIGENKESGRRCCSCIAKFIWEICRFNRIKIRKLRRKINLRRISWKNEPFIQKC